MEKQLNDASSFSRNQGRAYWFNGTLMEVKAMGEETNGVFCLIEGLLPAGYEAPMHIKRNEEDIFYVLEGEITFTLGENTIAGKPGTFVYAPRNVQHKFKVEGSSPAKMLIMFTPAGVERFYMENSVPAEEFKLPPDNIEFDLGKFIAAAQKYGIEHLG